MTRLLLGERCHGGALRRFTCAVRRSCQGCSGQLAGAAVDLEQYEVEDSIMGMMNDEFDTIVEDGSHSLVAQQLCLLYSQCWQGDTAAVQEKITQLAQKKYDVKAKVQEVTPSDDDDDEESSDDKEEAMDCENTPSSSYAASASGTLGPSPAPKKEEEAEDDGWTVVCRKKK
ncbi:pre-rRNA-processing protein TSR2 homolog isoform X2 [Xenopus tropicalis]|uniref:Pre-rRNA-processing protein TSR2 homolog n=1 Tax=Xenopus tropicalis TaxID=8364 RepID=A0A8J0SWF1_XENTR|nr:pre-rRNA-processing protein TSR2 homolog isoform X2 [Xenopus tropicalis]|eukprot:XP_017952394.1 PREDICTED: pre-rRNA-processing protein TSR2 homolog isoform X2 [Xenopus tropicalis]